jgi:hypothetical protein
MNVIATILRVICSYKTYASVILAVVSGLGLILTKNYSAGIQQILQALLVVFSGASAVSLRLDLEKVAAQVQAPTQPPVAVKQLG